MTLIETAPPSTIDSGVTPLSLVEREAWQDDVSRRQGVLGADSNLIDPLTLGDITPTLNDVNPNVLIDELEQIIRKEPGDDTDGQDLITHIRELRQRANPDLPSNFDEQWDGQIADVSASIMQDPKILAYIDGRRKLLDEPNRDLVAFWPEFTQKFVKGLENGINLGYIPDDVRDRVDDALTKTSVRMYDAAIGGAYSHATAYYDSTKDEIGLRHDHKDLPVSIDEDATHEGVHKLSGGTFIEQHSADDPDITIKTRSRVGLSTELRPDEMNRTGLNEAITEHVTLGMMDGDFETLDPDKRGELVLRYYGYRKVLADFVEKSKGHIQVKSLTRASFEDTGTDGKIDERSQLVREVRHAYGDGALRKLDKLFEATDMLMEQDKLFRLEKLVLSLIHAPEIDEDGNITKLGEIDVEHVPTVEDLYKETDESVGIKFRSVY